jgi:hypothetical protein
MLMPCVVFIPLFNTNKEYTELEAFMGGIFQCNKMIGRARKWVCKIVEIVCNVYRVIKHVSYASASRFGVSKYFLRACPFIILIFNILKCLGSLYMAAYLEGRPCESLFLCDLFFY